MEDCASQSVSPPPPADAATFPGHVVAAYSVEFLASSASNFLQVGIFFYTQKRFGWSLRSNFILASMQGVAYVLGAINANRITRYLPPRQAQACVHAAMMAAAMVGAMFPYSAVLAAMLLLYAGLAAVSWPILEGLVASGVENVAMARRIAVYNLIWAGAGAIVLAVNGWVIEHFSGGVFAFPAIFHGLCAMIMVITAREMKRGPQTAAPSPVPSVSKPHLQPEPELLRLRTSALWLSRVALPATYVLIYSLMALMPSLPVFRNIDTAHQTLIGSTWMAARLVAFVALGLGAWWHTRPRILLAAAILMLVGFLGVVIRPSSLVPAMDNRADLVSMALWQLLLGLSIGMIYSASLYFGMVLSEGSTEHGGYHEALIGLGSVLGPGAGAVAQWIRPGDVQAGIIAVGSIVTASVLAVAITAIILRWRDNRARE